MNKAIQCLMFLGTFLVIGSLGAGLTVGVQLKSYVNNGVASLSDPVSSIPEDYKCLYVKQWQDRPEGKGKHVVLTTQEAKSGPVTSEWGYIEFDESIFGCGWKENQFTSTIELYNDPKNWSANLTFVDDGTVSCSDSHNGAICNLVSWVPIDCPNSPTDSKCYQILVGATPNNYCITNANTYFGASAFCINDSLGFDSITINPGDTGCIKTEPSTTKYSVGVAAYNVSDCDDGGCNVLCNNESLQLSLSANTTTSIGCTNEACKVMDINLSGTLGAPAYQVLSTTQNTQAPGATKVQAQKQKIKRAHPVKENEEKAQKVKPQNKPEKNAPEQAPGALKKIS